jgi:endonuclease I
MYQYVDVYTNADGERVVKSVYTPDEYPVGDIGIPQNGVNCEHTYPQSFLKSSPRFAEARSDLFHLFPVNDRENTSRSNLPYANCGNKNPERGLRCSAGYEPPNAHKGIVARALFYIATTYSLSIDNAQESVLRKWHVAFPVTVSEVQRFHRVSDVQGNQNPFVTHPEWVNFISDF